MILSPGLRKAVLAAHVAVSVGWIGAVAVFLALGLPSGTGADAQAAEAAHAATMTARELIAWYVILPMTWAALATGVVLGLGTAWGLVRHWWVLVSLVLTAVAAVGLLAHLVHLPAPTLLGSVALVADRAGYGGLRGLGGGLLSHAGDGLWIPVVVTVLNVFKPRGLTRYGWRRRREERAERELRTGAQP